MSYAIHNKDKVFQNIDYIKRQLNMLYEENMEFKTTINSNIQSYNKLSKYSNELEDRIEKAIEYIRIYRSYQKIDNKDYLKGRDEIGCLDIYQVDELLDILKEVS